MKKRKVFYIVPVLAASLGLCGCVLTPPTLSSEMASPEIVTSEVVSEIISEVSSGDDWQKPVVTSEEKSEKPVKEEISYQFDFDSHNPNEWQIAYRDFLKTKNPANGGDLDAFEINTYFLADISERYGEYIPELCIKTGTCEADYELTIYDFNPETGKVEELVGEGKIGAGHSSFYVAPNGNLVSYGGHMGYLWVEEYTISDDGKVESETIFEEDLNKEQKEDYTPISEILGDQIGRPMVAPVSDDSILLWYLNIPVSTATGDEDEADVAITAALYDNADVYVVGCDQYYDGKTGLMPFHDLKKAGILDSYYDMEFDLNVYCFTDVNFDGQEEMLIRLASKERNESGEYNFAYVLLSYQDGAVYAYAFPHLTYSEDFVAVCEYSVYDNWYIDDTFYGFVFDKDRCNLMYSDDKPNDDPHKAESNVWKTFRVDFGY